MSFAKDDFAKLVRLQEKDVAVDALRSSIAQIPEDIAAINAEIEAEQSRLNGVHEKAKQVQAKKKDRENDMAQHEAAITKHQTELNSLKSNDAFKAMLKEIDDSKKAVGDLETEILTLMDEAEAVIREEKEIRAGLKEYEEKQREQIKILEGRKADLDAKLAKADEERKALAEGIPNELSELYEAIRSRRGGVAMARIVGNGCQVCHMKIPPQVLIDVKKGSKIPTCDSCQRILHDVEAVPSGTSA